MQKSPKLFFFTIEKEIRKVDKDGKEGIITISYIIKIIDNARCMASSVLNNIHNLAKKIHIIK